ncbi:MAG TPA: rhomboid family intramembrane serine protease [Opitutaceae bacterium]|nr:rhomboid family intramembrane serine protease [Opitutaceae bacterium]
MYGYNFPDNRHQPVMWLRGYPIYAAYFVVLVLVVSMLATTVMQALNAFSLAGWLLFDSTLVLRGEVWRIFTYGLVNPPSIWFVIDMLMIAWFGRELERFFGRRTFLWLYAGIYFLSPLLFTVIGVWWPRQLMGETGAFAIFIAFATLYPNVALLFNILAKWAAVILTALYALMALSNRDWVSLISLFATVGFAFAFVCYAQGRFTLPALRLPRRRPKLRVLPDPKPRTISSARASKGSPIAEIDGLLDKIARSGMSSLTPEERARLDAARRDLLKKQQGTGA